MTPAVPEVTLKAVAVRAGFSVATVSYALQDNAKIPERTRRRINAVAIALGYRANPRIASVMAHIRRSRHASLGDRIGFIWVHTSRALARKDPFLRLVYESACIRASQAGFLVEEFFPNEPGMSPRRLEQILRTRGISGILLSPVTTSEATVTMDWDWTSFSAAVIGNVAWKPELHHAAHHHFLGMHATLLEFSRRGIVRPAAVIEHESNTRAKRAWEAAFLAHHPAGPEAPQLVRLAGLTAGESLESWLVKSRCDGLIVSSTPLLDATGLRAVCAARNLPVATLSRMHDDPADISGVDQCYDRIASHAVDLVIAQLNSNETGVPDLPRMMLFPGRWVTGIHRDQTPESSPSPQPAAKPGPAGT